MSDEPALVSVIVNERAYVYDKGNRRMIINTPVPESTGWKQVGIALAPGDAIKHDGVDGIVEGVHLTLEPGAEPLVEYAYLKGGVIKRRVVRQSAVKIVGRRIKNGNRWPSGAEGETK